MARRFSDIERAGELKYAADNYVKYKTDIASRKSSRITGTGTPRQVKYKKVGVRPFSQAAGGATPVIYFTKRIISSSKGGTVIPSSVIGAGKFDNYYDETPANTTSDAPRGFRAARASIFEATTAAKYEKSKYTGLHYPKKEGKAAHYPIGRSKTTPLDEVETKKEIAGALVDDLNAVALGARLSFSDERAASV